MIRSNITHIEIIVSLSNNRRTFISIQRVSEFGDALKNIFLSKSNCTTANYEYVGG